MQRKEQNCSINKSDVVLEDYQRKLASPEHIKKRVDFYVAKSLRNLKSIFDQDNLSVIEVAKLRQIAEECVKQGLEETILTIKKEMPAQKMINVELEIVYRWLWDLYDIKKSDIPGEPFGNELLNVPEYFKETLRGLRGDSHLV